MRERRIVAPPISTRPPRTHTALPRLRIGVSVAVLAAMIAGAVFSNRSVVNVLDVVNVLGNGVAHSQLVPSMLRLRAALATGAGVALFVFPALVALTLLFGRGYCSSLCPLGTLQDAARFLRGTAKPIHLRFRSPRLLLRATITAVAFALWLLGGSLLLALLEPYAIVGRVLAAATALFAGGAPAVPPLELLPPAQGTDLVAAPAEIHATGLLSGLLAAVLLASVLAAATLKGRIFCNTLCPAGALLAAPAAVSLLRVRLAADRCTSCGACERVCPARCIDGAHKRIAGGSCILCFSCLAACPQGALSYAIARRRR